MGQLKEFKMRYTVNKLAKLSGVSSRTLRFYDKIDLLKPVFYGGNQYRYYEEGQLLMGKELLDTHKRELRGASSNVPR